MDARDRRMLLALHSYNLLLLVCSRCLTVSPNIIFPSPMHPFVGAQVLVQSLAKGIPLGKFLNAQELDRDRIDLDADSAHKSIAERITKSHLLRHEQAVREAQETGAIVPLPPSRIQVSPLHSEIARLGLQMYLHMLMEDNFVHSDLHPGNILVQLPGLVNDASQFDGNIEELVHSYSEASSEFLKSSHVNLVILDSGLVSVLSPRNRRNFISLFGALILVS
jgi:predicted unusual protein kinase regulating ubiquinone biosynthesis (AarF/ABC1/UbiB family)